MLTRCLSRRTMIHSTHTCIITRIRLVPSDIFSHRMPHLHLCPSPARFFMTASSLLSPISQRWCRSMSQDGNGGCGRCLVATRHGPCRGRLHDSTTHAWTRSRYLYCISCDLIIYSHMLSTFSGSKAVAVFSIVIVTYLLCTRHHLDVIPA